MQIPVLYSSSLGSSGIDLGVPLGWQAFVCPTPRGHSSWLAKSLIVVLYSISLLHPGRDATCSEHVDTRLHSRAFPSLAVGFSSAAEPSDSRLSAPPPSPRSPLSPQNKTLILRGYHHILFSVIEHSLWPSPTWVPSTSSGQERH